MKRLRLWVNELSLFQQLISIIFLFIAIFASFIFFFLTPALDRFSEAEMYNQLHNSQTNLISYVDQYPDVIPSSLNSDNATVIHVIFVTDKDEFITPSNVTLSKEIREDIHRNAELDLSGTQDYSFVYTDTKGSKSNHYMYSMTLLKDGRYLVSLLSDAYRVQFRESIVSGVIMMNVMIVSFLFVLLMIWVGSLIYPLSQIKAYIQKIKNDEPANMNVKRNDEIGQVADALKEMENELSRQNRQKQEMIQNISHDLKTPIATIKSYSEAIKDGIYPYETLEKSCDVIIEHADRLEKKVKSLIVLNKMDYLLDDCPEGETLNMNEVIEKAILSLKVVRPEIEIRSETDGIVKFHGEEEPWRITVENLIDNALRYADTKIIVRLNQNELCVINDGKPIEQDRIASLFHPYEKGTGGQFGLGLSIVHRVCTTYGYHVQAENMPDGVCFRIWQDKNKKVKKRHTKERKKTVNS